MVDKIVEAVDLLNRFIWGVPSLIMILSVGIYLSIRTGFAQLRLFPKAFRKFCRSWCVKNTGANGISSRQAVCTALAATVGTGNLAGVAGAIAIGGPGAVFWMWICAFFGMVTKYAEATLAVAMRFKTAAGEVVGGPMYMIRRGMGKKWNWLSVLYCCFGIIAAFGVGNAVQINTVINSVNSVLTVFGGRTTTAGNALMGIVLAIIVALMLSGGAGRIGDVAERLVPFAALLYILMCFGVLCFRADAIGSAFVRIFKGAFQPAAVTGGVIGSLFVSLRTGAARGVFTNEAGMGTAAIAHASAMVDHPAEQGLMGIMEVFIDTIVICTMTALVILSSGVDIPYGQDTGITLTGAAFSCVYGKWVCVPLSLCLCCFAVATILGWGIYGVRCAQYIFGEDVWKRFVLFQAAGVILGAVLGTGTVWSLSEILNGLMTIPNLIALAWLSPSLVELTKEFKYGSLSAGGGIYENIYQCKQMRTFPHAEVSPPGRQS